MVSVDFWRLASRRNFDEKEKTFYHDDTFLSLIKWQNRNHFLHFVDISVDSVGSLLHPATTAKTYHQHGRRFSLCFLIFYFIFSGFPLWQKQYFLIGFWPWKNEEKVSTPGWHRSLSHKNKCLSVWWKQLRPVNNNRKRDEKSKRPVSWYRQGTQTQK